METLVEHLDILIQAPLAAIVILYIYMSQNRFKQIIEGDQKNFEEVLKSYQKIIDRLIDKIKK